MYLVEAYGLKFLRSYGFQQACRPPRRGEKCLLSVSVKNFRCFQDFSIDSLERVNLIAGKKNAGKTTLLEAIFLLTAGTNPGIVVTLAAGRSVERFNSSAATEWVHLTFPRAKPLDSKVVYL